MASRELGFNIVGKSQDAQRAFGEVADELKRVSNKVDQVNGKTAEVSVEVKQMQQLEKGLSRLTTGVTDLILGLGKLHPIILGAVVVAFVSMLGAITAAVSAGVAGAASIGGAFAAMGLGAKLYAQTEQGKQAIKDFKNTTMEILKGAAQPLFDSFSNALGALEFMMGDLTPVFQDTFSALSKVVTEVTYNAIPAFEELAPAVGSIVDAGLMFFRTFSDTFGMISSRLTPALQALTPELRATAGILGNQLGRTIANLLPKLVRLAREALPMLPGLFTAFAGAVRFVIFIANQFLNVIGFVAVALGKVRLRVAQAQLAFYRFRNTLPGVNTQARITATRARVASIKMNQAGLKAHFFSKGSGKLAKNLGKTKTQARQANTNISNLWSTMNKAVKGAITYESSLDRMIKELKEGNVQFNIATKEGRENTKAVFKNIGAARSQIKTYDKQERKMGFITGEIDRMSAAFVKEAKKAGATEKQIMDLIARQENIPPEVRTFIKNNADSAREAVEMYLNDGLSQIPDKKTTVLDVDTSPGWRSFDEQFGLTNIAGMRHGGLVQGKGTETSDSNLRRLSKGEFVMSANSVSRLGVDVLRGLNRGLSMAEATDDTVSPAGMTAPTGTSTVNEGGDVYNIYASHNAPASEIIDRALFKSRRPKSVGGRH